MNLLILNQKFLDFKEFIEEKDNNKFFSFESQPYIKKHESYKAKICATGYERLCVDKWKFSDTGTGKIINYVKDAINLEDNNLLIHDNRNGEDSRPDKSLYKQYDSAILKEYETAILDFYHDNVSDKESFNRILKFSGKQYPFIAYLFFLKSKKKYLPIAPRTFDDLFKTLEINLRTSRKCSWENYLEYISVIKTIQNYLQNKTGFENEEITLLDSHSFLWILGSHMENWNSKRKTKQDLEANFMDIEANKRQVNLNPTTKSSSQSEKKRDHLKDYFRKSKLGNKSEEIVFNHESKFNNFVKSVSDNESLGYDIEVRNKSNEIIKRIEVKTESINSSFIITQNEIQKSNQYDNYYIYIVENPESERPVIKSLIVKNILEELTCIPIGYRVYF